MLRDYDLILNCLHFRTLFQTATPRHCISYYCYQGHDHSILDTVDIPVSALKTREFSTFSVRGVEQLRASLQRTVCADFGKFSVGTASSLSILSCYMKMFG
jgi:hypothetical protein